MLYDPTQNCAQFRGVIEHNCIPQHQEISVQNMYRAAAYNLDNNPRVAYLGKL